MKKNILNIVIIALLSLGLVSCGSKENVITVVATEKPHAEILRKAEPILKEQGYKLKIQVIDDYSRGNPEVEKGKADANFFQHVPYFNSKNTNDLLVNLGGVHLEPIGLYGGTINSIDDLKDGDKIVISDNQPDYGRIVLFLSNLGLVEVVNDFDPLNNYSNPELAIKSKVKDFKFEIIDANLLVTAKKNKQGALFFINGNYAITGNLSLNEAIEKESTNNNPYVNILVVKKTDKDLPKLKALLEVLQSAEIKKFINDKYDGSVIPA
jgi:D-methionine transport system substrate-binding protein